MSNKFIIFFYFLFPTLLMGATPLSVVQRDSLLQRADYLFQYEQFAEAGLTYETLLQQGYFQEKMLYRMAFMAEEEEQYAQSIYYLRKLQWEIGGENLSEKIIQLMDQSSRERVSSGESWSSLQVSVHQQYRGLFLGLLLLTCLGVLSLWWPNPPLGRWLGIGAAGLSICLSLLWLRTQNTETRLGVVMYPTMSYNLPGYGADFRNLPISPGATVQVLEQQDIWQRISMGQFEAWVPGFVVREI
jgi:hypothetical protein